MKHINQPILVSICIPAYNAAPYIGETIECWLNQTYPNIEIIVQDDCSTDDTYHIALELSRNDHRLKVYKNIKNLGIGDNWNEAYKKTVGEFVVIANADDIYNSKMIENALNIFQENQKLDAVSFKYNLLLEDLNEIKELDVHSTLNIGLQKDLFKICFFQNPFSIVFSVFKRESLKKILLDGENLFLNTQICDAELFFRAGKNNFSLYYSDYVAGKYRKHTSNNSYIKNGERYSWLFDVFPKYRQYLLINHQKQTKDLLLGRMIHHLKYQIKNFRFPDFKQLNAFFREYYAFWKYKNQKAS